LRKAQARAPETGREALKRGATFKVDYFLYSGIVLTLLGIVVFAIRLNAKRHLQDRQMKLADRARRRRERTAKDRAAKSKILPHQQAVLQRQLKNVPTPWGWPGSASRSAPADANKSLSPGVQASSGLFQRWIDQLVAEKRTVDDGDYLESRHAALRSMIEDRFGRTPQPQEMAYQNVRPPRLMDPQRPHDQMDNFPSGKVEKIVSGLTGQPGDTRSAASAPAVRRKAQLGDIRTPWGW